jgi:hypothetical protein
MKKIVISTLLTMLVAGGVLQAKQADKTLAKGGWSRPSEVKVDQEKSDWSQNGYRTQKGFDNRAEKIRSRSAEFESEAKGAADQGMTKARQRFGEVSESKLKLLTTEQNHHERRMAQIDRIEQLAAKKGNQTLLRKSQLLRVKEGQRHMRKVQNLQIGD